MKPATNNLVSLESIKLHLVQNNTLAPAKDYVSLEELIEFLIESLEEADTTSANRTENLMVKIGTPAIPFLIKGLKSSSNTVKSVCAMSLIRIGQPAVEALKEFYVRAASRPASHAKIKWVVEFIFTELCETLPVVEEDLPVVVPAVLELSRVG